MSIQHVQNVVLSVIPTAWLHALTLAACSYTLLTDIFMVQISAVRVYQFCIFHSNEINTGNLKADTTAYFVELATEKKYTRKCCSSLMLRRVV